MGFTAALLLGYQVYSGEQQRRQQKKQLRMQEQANADARKQAKEAADRADVEMNKAKASPLGTSVYFLCILLMA